MKANTNTKTEYKEIKQALAEKGLKIKLSGSSNQGIPTYIVSSGRELTGGRLLWLSDVVRIYGLIDKNRSEGGKG